MINPLKSLFPNGLSGNGLKLLACFFMFVDHLGMMLFPQYPWLRHLGRLAFPIFAYMLGEGYRHTRSKKRYLLRLCCFAVLFQWPYQFFTGCTDSNIFGELALGLLAIYSFDRLFRWQPAGLACIPPLFIGVISQLANFQYGFYGISLIFCGYLFAGKEKELSLSWLLVNVIPILGLLQMSSNQVLSLFALPLLFTYNGKRGKGSKWFFYAFYCLHLPLLWLLAQCG